MRIKLIISIIIASLPASYCFAQKTFSFSVKQAVDYAMKNSMDVQNALIDISIQKQTNREITALALPQINGNVTMNHFYDIPVTTLPDFISPAVYGVLVQNGVKDGSGNAITFPAGGFNSLPARFGTSWNATGGMDISQILFDGQVFIGLKARSSALTLASQSASVTREQIKANVCKLYYQIVVGNQQSTTIDANIERFEKLLNDTKEIYKNGFAERLDVDKVEVQLNNLKTEKLKISNQLEMANAALKFLINMSQKDTLLLTDSITENEIKDISLGDSLDVKNRKEYQQLQTAIKLNEYNVKRYQLSRIPTFVAFGSYSKNAQRNQFNFFDKGDWFSTTLAGIKVSVPIFDGNARRSRIMKARYELDKTKNNMHRLEQAIEMEADNARLKLTSAIQTVDVQSKNVKLAEKVFSQTKLKYDQGLGSNMEIYNSQTELKMAQNNYYGALYDALIAKIDYLKATGKLPY